MIFGVPLALGRGLDADRDRLFALLGPLGDVLGQERGDDCGVGLHLRLDDCVLDRLLHLGGRGEPAVDHSRQARLTTAAIAGCTEAGSGTGGRPLVSTMSACTSFSPSYGGLPDSR